MPELVTRFARVDYSPALARAVGQTLLRGSGYVSRGSLIQYAAHLAVLRNFCTFGALGRVAHFDPKTGKFLGTEFVGSYERGKKIFQEQAKPDAKTAVLPIFGVELLAHPAPGGAGLPDDWGAKLALAIDGTLEKMAKTKGYEQAPPEAMPAFALPAAPILAIIVAGTAVTVILSVAAYRYFDPEVAKRALEVQAASEAFSARLATFAATGTMPAPSPVELAAKDAIIAGAKDQGKSDWIYAAAITGGVVAVAAGAAWLGSRAA